ncbi:unnamed protein product [Caenorhabditis auriculariae]|uniref:Peptidase M12B domain-containing protein n=1 Tax=Caenorhabditis auriculariae TaxID=2777116 RepID=A0A8S1H0A2_9PELO|nr:unnamed protein product [Caenorhabditis auriculariae]
MRCILKFFILIFVPQVSVCDEISRFFSTSVFERLQPDVIRISLNKLDLNIVATLKTESQSLYEYLASFSESLPGRGSLSEIAEDAFIGSLLLPEDTLYLDPYNWHFPTKESNKIIAYFDSDITRNTNRSLGYIDKSTNSPQRPNPFLSYQRQKRDVSYAVKDVEKNRCELKIVADYTFFKVVGKQSKAITIKYLVNTIARVNEIYTSVNWDEGFEHELENRQRGRLRNIGFSIKEIAVLEKPSPNRHHYNYHSEDDKWNSKKLLEAFSFEEGSSNFCLVMLVTARNFEESEVLGLAYVARPPQDGSDVPGGLCSTENNVNNRYVPVNTLFTTALLSNGENGITQGTDIIVAHEFGHAFGAPHDPEPTEGRGEENDNCFPSFKEGGSYIMHRYAQAGYDRNNYLFSPCSRKVIRTLLGQRFETCFTKEKTSDCGNGVIEDSEQCDNGDNEALLHTQGGARCCDKFCQLAVGAVCSPNNHACCSDQCQFLNNTHVCLPGDTFHCKGDSHCSGISGECPEPPPVKNGLPCFDKGECQKGVCVPYLEDSCHRCCRSSSNETCVIEPSGGLLRDGTNCLQGFCKNSICVNKVTDNVINYVTSLKDSQRLWTFFKNNIVLYCVCKHDSKEKKMSKKKLKNVVVAKDFLPSGRGWLLKMLRLFIFAFLTIVGFAASAYPNDTLTTTTPKGGTSIAGTFVTCHTSMENCLEACYMECFVADFCNDVPDRVACAPGLPQMVLLTLGFVILLVTCCGFICFCTPCCLCAIIYRRRQARKNRAQAEYPTPTAPPLLAKRPRPSPKRFGLQFEKWLEGRLVLLITLLILRHQMDCLVHDPDLPSCATEPTETFPGSLDLNKSSPNDVLWAFMRASGAFFTNQIQTPVKATPKPKESFSPTKCSEGAEDVFEDEVLANELLEISKATAARTVSKKIPRLGSPVKVSNLARMFTARTEELRMPIECVCHCCFGKMVAGHRTVLYKGSSRSYPCYRCTRKGCQTFASMTQLHKKLVVARSGNLRKRRFSRSPTPQEEIEIKPILPIMAEASDATSFSTTSLQLNIPESPPKMEPGVSKSYPNLSALLGSAPPAPKNFRDNFAPVDSRTPPTQHLLMIANKYQAPPPEPSIYGPLWEQILKILQAGQK